MEERAVPEMPSYVFEELPGRADPLIVLSAVDCYLYQTSGEPDEFEDTLVFGFTHWLYAAAAMRLPCRDDAPWPIEHRDVFLHGAGGGERSPEPRADRRRHVAHERSCQPWRVARHLLSGAL